MESKMFNTHLNPYVAHTPIEEQLSIWLEDNPDIKIKELQVNKEDALVIYERENTTS